MSFTVQGWHLVVGLVVALIVGGFVVGGREARSNSWGLSFFGPLLVVAGLALGMGACAMWFVL